jgi:hypothetical protein
MTAEAAIAWVDENVKQIAGHSRKYLPYAPYDQEDFLQDAYEAALEAATVSMERQVFFPACFWTLYKGKISAVTPNPDSKCKAGSSAPPRAFCDSSDFTSKQFVQDDTTHHLEPLFNIDVDQAYPFVRHYLTPKEEQILEALLGIHGGTMKIKEAARHLECSPANVRQALNRVCRRISSLVSSGELDAEFVESEIMKQFEVMLEAEKPEEKRTAKPDSRRDASSGGDSQKERPRCHQDSHNGRKADSRRSMDAKTHQAPHSNMVVANEVLQVSSLGVISIPGTDMGFSILGTVPTRDDFMDHHQIKRTGSRYDFCFENTNAFAASNNSSTIRSIVLCPHRQSRKEPVDNVISLFDRKVPHAPTLNQNNNRNGPINVYLDRYGGASPVKQDRSPPVRVAKRKRNIERIGRKELKNVFNDIVSVGDLAESIQRSMAA